MSSAVWYPRYGYTEATLKIKANLTQPKEITPREHEVIQLILTAATNRDIAKELKISTETVKRHLSNIYDKLGVFTRMELCTKLNGLHVKKEIEEGWAPRENEWKQRVESLEVENARLVSQLTLLQGNSGYS